ncbi:MAG: glycosyltransferase family 2 protein [Candidatus Aenigmatarchaeota archaeon]
MNLPLVCLLVLNWNGKELTKDCLRTLKITKYPNYKVLVIDNGSQDGSVEYIKKHFPDVEVLELEKNYGFAGGMNRGIKYVLSKYSPKYIGLLNNDLEFFDKNWLLKVINVFKENERIGIVGCKLLYPDRTTIQHAYTSLINNRIRIVGRLEKDRGQHDIIKEVDISQFGCVLINTEVFKTIGYLDEVFLFSAEDCDFCIRAKKAGFKVFYCGTSNVIHKVSKTTVEKVNKLLRIFVTTKNALIFHLRYFPLTTVFKELLICLAKCMIERNEKRETTFNLYFPIRIVLVMLAFFSAIIYKNYRIIK